MRVTTSLEVLVEIPALALLLGEATTPRVTSEQVGVNVEKLAYHPGVSDVWNLPAEQPALAGMLDLDGAVPLMRCTLPLPAPEEVALYRVTILKTGAALDAEGKTHAQQLLPTEEELLFFVIGAAEANQGLPEAARHLVPGIQCVVVPVSRPSGAVAPVDMPRESTGS